MCDSEEVAIIIPQVLKTHLEDDCVEIVKRRKLLKLPRQPNVETILKDYFSYNVANTTEETNLALTAEVLDGIKIYFDFVLSDHLLYSQERQQYVQFFPPQHQLQVSPQPNSSDGINGINHISALDGVNNMNHKQATLLPSSVYGAEHLLRLFVKFPRFLSKAQFPSAHIHLLHQYFKDFFVYIAKTPNLFAEESYEVLDTDSTDTGNSMAT